MYFGNLAQLPISRFRYRLDPATLIRAGDHYSALVEMRLQLWGFDQWPIVSREAVGFAPGPDGSSYVLAQEGGEDSSGQQPWDSRAIVVRERPGVLGIFDRESADQADAGLASVAAGIELVSANVPYDWDRQVVVYALSGTSSPSAIAGLPGGDPERLDGVSLPVGERGDEAASTRLVLHPRMLSAPPAQRDRLVRHELTHIAIAGSDNHVPTWLSEGIAEYVSVQPIAEADRTLARPAVVAASSASLKLPEAKTFNGPDSEANYGVAWWACEALVDLYGEPMLWQLLDDIHAAIDELIPAKCPGRIDPSVVGNQELGWRAAFALGAPYWLSASCSCAGTCPKARGGSSSTGATKRQRRSSATSRRQWSASPARRFRA